MSMNNAPMLELSVTAVSSEIDIGIRADSVEMISQTARAPQIMSKLGHIRLTPGTRVVISNNEFSIGRGSENDLYIRDLRISRQHARIFADANNAFVLHNLSASNPTALNNQRLESNKQRPMADSGLIQLADIVNIEFTNSVGAVQLHTIPREVALAKPVNVLDLQGVGRQFGQEQIIHALKDVNLGLAPGEWLSITGPSGAGKSTLLNIIGCLDHPTSGTYLFDGIDTTELTDQERAGLRSRRIGFVFQSFHLLPHRSVLENVMLAEVYRQQSLTGRRERALAALERVGLGNRVNFRPTELSGGQRQRVAIARALIGYPSLLVCDEPTGNLDSKTTDDILDLFETLNQEGLTLVVVTHEEDVAKRANRRVQIVDGQLSHLTPVENGANGQNGANRSASSAIERDGNSGRADVAASQRQPARRQPARRPAPQYPAASGRFGRLSTLFSRFMPSRWRRPPKPPSSVELSGITVRDLLDEAVAGMFARPGRMVLTMLGIVIGITALVATIGLSRTASNRITTRFDELAATEIIVTGKSTLAGVDPRAIPWDAPTRLQRLNGVVAAGALSDVDIGDAVIKTSSVSDPYKISVQAASPGLFNAVKADLQTGRFFDQGHSNRMEKVAVLGPRAAERLGIMGMQQLPAITIGDHVYLIMGILRDVARRPDMLGSVIIPEGSARNHFGLIGPETVVVETRIGAAQLIGKQTRPALRPDDEGSLTIQVAPEPQRVRDAVQNDLNVMLLFLGGLSLVVGAIGIGNITLVSVIERTGEIGLRRAIGATRSHIATQFLLESASMGLIGGILGSGIGILIVVAVSAYQVWTPVLDPVTPVIAPLVGGFIGLVSGVYPALRAARLEPVEAFRN